MGFLLSKVGDQDDDDGNENYVNVGLFEVVVQCEDDEGRVEHQGKNGSKNEEHLIKISSTIVKEYMQPIRSDKKNYDKIFATSWKTKNERSTTK